MHTYWQNLACDCYMSFFALLYQSYGPWFEPKFCFGSISGEPIGRISPIFISAFILARSNFGLLHTFFTFLYQSHGPLLTPKVCFHSIPLESIDRISPNFIYAFILTRSSLGLIHVIFPHLYQNYGPLYSPQKNSPQYPENKLTEIHQILYMHSYWQDLGWNYYLFFFFFLHICKTMSWPLFDVRILFLLNVFRFSYFPA